MTDGQFKEIIRFAINEEYKAAEFYKDLRDRVKKETAKTIISDFVEMELGHARILENYKNEGLEEFVKPNIPNLKISDYLVVMEEKDQLSFQEILIIAMKKEEAAKNLYNDLAEKAVEKKTKNLFHKLASEEEMHKYKLESIYDDIIYKEN